MTPSFKPVVMGAVHLNHLPKTLFSFSPLPVFFPFPFLLPKSLFYQPLPQGLFTYAYLVYLLELLCSQGVAKVMVLPFVKPYCLPSDICGYLTVGRLATGFVNNPPFSFFTNSLYQPAYLTL